MQTRNTSRPARGKARRLSMLPGTGGEEYFNGQFLCVELASGLGLSGRDAAGLKFWGVIVEPLLPDEDQGYKRGWHLDNRQGQDGVVRGDAESSERYVRADIGLSYAFQYIGPEPKSGQKAYIVDDDTFTVDPDLTSHAVECGLVDRIGPNEMYFLDFIRN